MKVCRRHDPYTDTLIDKFFVRCIEKLYRPIFVQRTVHGSEQRARVVVIVAVRSVKVRQELLSVIPQSLVEHFLHVVRRSFKFKQIFAVSLPERCVDIRKIS